MSKVGSPPAARRAETQYLVATPGGTARLIWAESNGAPGNGAFAVFNREARLTMNVTDLLQSTSAVIDLFDGDVLERGTYLPSGVRETRTLDEAQEAFPLEPLGFTGKEDDLEVGLMYFGHRYLMPHLGRWASPDPLQIHSGGGGEFGNSYHYVGGNLLQARDPDGLDAEYTVEQDNASVNITAHVELVVYQDSVFSNADEYVDVLRSQADFWNGRTLTSTTTDGRALSIQFDITVRLATATESALIERTLDETVFVNGTNTFFNTDAAQATRSHNALARLVRRGAFGRGSNVVLAGAVGTGEAMTNQAFVETGAVMRYTAGALNADRAGSLLGAHEIGHLMGLAEKYNQSTGRTLPGFRGNIMANFQTDAWRGRTWVSHDQIRFLETNALGVDRSSPAGSSGAQPLAPGIIGQLGGSPRHYSRRWIDRRTPRSTTWGCSAGP